MYEMIRMHEKNLFEAIVLNTYYKYNINSSPKQTYVKQNDASISLIHKRTFGILWNNLLK